MKKFNMLYHVFCAVFLLVAMSACCSFKQNSISVEKVNTTIGDAHSYLTQAIKVKDSYPTDFKKAEEFLNEAWSLRDNCERDKAYEKASESTNLSKKILADDVIEKGKIAKDIKFNIEQKPKESSLRSLLPKLEQIINYAKQLETGQQITLSGYIDFNEGYQRTVIPYIGRIQEKIDAPISFRTGKYKIDDLLSEAKQVLDKIVRDIIDSYLKFNIPPEKKIIRIDTVGYTDELPFRDVTLIRELKNGLTEIPENPPDKRRKALNENLSYFRSETIAKYLKQRLESENSKLNVKINPRGKGEAMPEGKYKPTPPYSENDPRRRICIIECFIEGF